MKVTFNFDTEDIDQRLEMERMLKAEQMSFAINEIYEQVFRPAFKHGYDKKLEDLIALCPEVDTDCGKTNVAYEIISLLSEKYFDILDNRDLKGME